MPTYEYECQKCGHVFEKFHGISDPPPKTCPKCKSRRVKRKIGAGAGILFKGSGFYQTDYRSDSYHKEAKKEKSAKEPKDTPKKESKAKSETPKKKGGGSSAKD